jgi:hypothetical protein
MLSGNRREERARNLAPATGAALAGAALANVLVSAGLVALATAVVTVLNLALALADLVVSVVLLIAASLAGAVVVWRMLVSLGVLRDYNGGKLTGTVASVGNVGNIGGSSNSSCVSINRGSDGHGTGRWLVTMLSSCSALRLKHTRSQGRQEEVSW